MCGSASMVATSSASNSACWCASHRAAISSPRIAGTSRLACPRLRQSSVGAPVHSPAMFRRVLLISTIMLALVASACSDGGGGGDDASTTSGVDLTELGPEGSLPPAPEGLEGLVI